MRWIKFPDGRKYTFASDIQKLAEAHGYKVPCEPDGTRHPGTDCNAKMRTIFKDAGMRHAFNITSTSVVDVCVEDSVFNQSFIQWLVDKGLLSDAYLRHKSIQLYTEQAVNALVSSMLKSRVLYFAGDDDPVWNCSISIITRSHNLEKKRNKPKASLFKK